MTLQCVQEAEQIDIWASQRMQTFFCMSVKGVLGLIWGLSLWLSGEEAVAQGYCRADLVEKIDAIATRPNLTRAHLGLLVETQAAQPSERQSILERNVDKWFVPASTLKLLTTAAAVQQLGPGFQIKTSAHLQQQGEQTNVYVIGRGDPTFDDDQLQDLSQQITQQSIPKIDQLLGYDSYFAGRNYLLK